MTGYTKCHHGMAKAHGCKHVAVGKFSKLFDLPNLVVTEEEAAIIGGPGGVMHDFDGGSPDCEIPAGYIFFAQFVDHDITLDAFSALRGSPLSKEEVEKIGNIRSASLDLDCVYGFGPEASPHIYDAHRPGRIAVSESAHDLARSPDGTALIGDPRNDENIFVAQMQLLFQKCHNKIYDERIYQEDSSEAFNRFEEAQKQSRYHYQWIVLFDFLKRLCHRETFEFAVPKLLKKKKKDYPLIYGLDAHGKLTMPVEFSVAAYRVGHTMVRSVYAVDESHTDIELFDEAFNTQGFGAAPEELVVDWRYLLPVDDCIRPRMSNSIDPLLADELQDLPVVPSNNPADRALAFRNILRANSLGLASGQDVATALQAAGYPDIDPGLDLQFDNVPGWERLDRLASSGTSHLRDSTPLFYYLLRESELVDDGQRFGPTGSALLFEVFGGMLALCGTSFLHEDDWHPDPCISKEKYGWWTDRYQDSFSHKLLIEDPDYFPLELADIVRFVES